jgi:hypothetical protein
VKRRHFFDNGYPVTRATLVAGAHVLLAVARQSVRKSNSHLVTSCFLLADCSQRIVDTLARCGCTRAQLRESEENPGCGSTRQPSKSDPRHQPPDRPARAQPHHR